MRVVRVYLNIIYNTFRSRFHLMNMYAPGLINYDLRLIALISLINVTLICEVYNRRFICVYMYLNLYRAFNINLYYINYYNNVHHCRSSYTVSSTCSYK